MNWYKKALALDPRAWEYEESPARLQKDQPFAVTPWGKIKQEQDPEKLKEDYTGVHLTTSPEIAAVYANGKATRDDPPVVIEIYSGDLTKLPDVDVAQDYALPVYIDEKKDEWQQILETEASDEDKRAEIINDIYGDTEFWESDSEDLLESLVNQERSVPPVAINEHLESLPDDQVIQVIREMINGNIPTTISTEVVNQYRVLHPVGSNRVVAIHEVDFVNFESEHNVYQLQNYDEEELENAGITKVDEYTFLDSDGRKILDYEDLDYSWLNLRPIYESKQLMLFPEQTKETSYHGTTLSRAKLAFPELLQ